MKQIAGPPVLEPEQQHVEAELALPATGDAPRPRSIGLDRLASRARTQPGVEAYRTVLACSLDDETA